MGRSRRSSSAGSLSEATPKSTQQQVVSTKEAVEATRQLFDILIGLRNNVNGKSFLHNVVSNHDMGIAQSLLRRATLLDQWQDTETTSDTPPRRNTTLERLLLAKDLESGYTPLHWAVMERNLAVVLQILRHVVGATSDVENGSSYRLTQRPMHLLQGDIKNDDMILKIVNSTDNEGLNPLELLCRLQRSELAQCRQSLAATNNVLPAGYVDPRRQVVFDQDEALDNEFHVLQEPSSTQTTSGSVGSVETNKDCGCEVLTFGRVNHCALGGDGGSSDKHPSSSTSKNQVRPQRVQAFALADLGTDQSAVAVAAAAHHTLVATRNGRLYAFGLGKGGRLGTGDERHRPVPTRVLGPLARRKIVAVAAAENHSVCVTSDGSVYAWGSNRFGQLGTNAVEDSNVDSQQRCLPRKVDSLKQVFCVSVAAGDRHSVALSNKGEVYTWGDNQAGQLGIILRGGGCTGSPSGGVGGQQVNRVDTLWGASPRRVAIAISAAAQSTLVLTCPPKTSASLPTNAVYSWGHGNHVPIKVNFSHSDTSRVSNDSLATGSSLLTKGRVNPVAIACAKYHNAAITSDGRVFTWGLHAEPLGTTGKKTKRAAGSMVIASPQVVTGMLPENGGGMAVAVSACDNHTAVLTDCGHLYTWGATYGKDVLGHEGVRWQPNPKKVPGVYRAVGVAAAKEHTVLLVGTSFPRRETASASTELSSLETLAAKAISKHVDLFNVIPILVIAERTNCLFLTEYCLEFIRLNLDGVLTLGKKSEMDRYLKDKLADGGYKMESYPRDLSYHPLLFDLVASKDQCELRSSDRDDSNELNSWMESCKGLLDRLPISLLSKHSATYAKGTQSAEEKLGHCRRDRALSFNDQESADREVDGNHPEKATGRQGSFRGCSERCLMLTANMRINSEGAARSMHDRLSKEIRSVRKRLNQISTLEQTQEGSKAPSSLSQEQKQKLARRPLLEADLDTLESAVQQVESKMKSLGVSVVETKEENSASITGTGAKANEEAKPVPSKDDIENEKRVAASGEIAKPVPESFRCNICQITCPDANSLALHTNGRKHRNRVAQAEEEERQRTATSMMEMKRRQLVKEQVPQKWSNPTAIAWHMHSAPVDNFNLSVQPKFKLPPPPTFPSPETKGRPGPPLAEKKPSWSSPLVPSKKTLGSKKSSSFRSILEDEENRVGKKGQKVPSPVARAVHPTPSTPPTFSLGSDCAALDSFAKKTYSLGDFLASPSSSEKTKTPPAPWSASPPVCSAVKATSSASPVVAKSFLEIQKEEQDLRTRQDSSCGMDGHWYVERRERAGSISQIQQEETIERERVMHVEEQKRIEREILREREEEKQRRRRGNQSRKNTKKKQRPAGDRRKKGQETSTQSKSSSTETGPNDGKPKNGNKNSRRRSNKAKKPSTAHKEKAPAAAAAST